MTEAPVTGAAVTVHADGQSINNTDTPDTDTYTERVQHACFEYTAELLRASTAPLSTFIREHFGLEVELRAARDAEPDEGPPPSWQVCSSA